MRYSIFFFFFFFNDTATTEIYTLSLHDALPISAGPGAAARRLGPGRAVDAYLGRTLARPGRSEEHTSELQSQSNLVCRLLLEKKKQVRTREEGPHRDFSGAGLYLSPADRQVLNS